MNYNIQTYPITKKEYEDILKNMLISLEGDKNHTDTKGKLTLPMGINFTFMQWRELFTYYIFNLTKKPDEVALVRLNENRALNKDAVLKKQYNKEMREEQIKIILLYLYNPSIDNMIFKIVGEEAINNESLLKIKENFNSFLKKITIAIDKENQDKDKDNKDKANEGNKKLTDEEKFIKKIVSEKKLLDAISFYEAKYITSKQTSHPIKATFGSDEIFELFLIISKHYISITIDNFFKKFNNKNNPFIKNMLSLASSEPKYYKELVAFIPFTYQLEKALDTGTINRYDLNKIFDYKSRFLIWAFIRYKFGGIRYHVENALQNKKSVKLKFASKYYDRMILQSCVFGFFNKNENGTINKIATALDMFSTLNLLKKKESEEEEVDDNKTTITTPIKCNPNTNFKVFECIETFKHEKLEKIKKEKEEEKNKGNTKNKNEKNESDYEKNMIRISNEYSHESSKNSNNNKSNKQSDTKKDESSDDDTQSSIYKESLLEDDFIHTLKPIKELADSFKEQILSLIKQSPSNQDNSLNKDNLKSEHIYVVNNNNYKDTMKALKKLALKNKTNILVIITEQIKDPQKNITSNYAMQIARPKNAILHLAMSNENTIDALLVNNPMKKNNKENDKCLLYSYEIHESEEISINPLFNQDTLTLDSHAEKEDNQDIRYSATYNNITYNFKNDDSNTLYVEKDNFQIRILNYVAEMLEQDSQNTNKQETPNLNTTIKQDVSYSTLGIKLMVKKEDIQTKDNTGAVKIILKAKSFTYDDAPLFLYIADHKKLYITNIKNNKACFNIQAQANSLCPTLSLHISQIPLSSRKQVNANNTQTLQLTYEDIQARKLEEELLVVVQKDASNIYKEWSDKNYEDNKEGEGKEL